MSQIWTEKYKPGTCAGIAGQDKAVDEALGFVNSFQPGHAAMLTGPPGCGKTLTVETIAAEKGLELMQLNASDKRNTDEIEAFGQTTKTMSLFGKGKIILIDEVDGISGRDRGAVGAIVKLIKSSSFPVFLIANDSYSKKLRPLKPYVKPIKFHKVRAPSMAKRLREICISEGIEPDEDALKNLARFGQGDMRSTINDLQMACQGKTVLKTDDLSILGYRERKSTVFDILPAVFKSGSIAASRKAIYSADSDSDEIFWWLESNAHQVYKDPDQLAAAFEILAKADFFRSLVINQQNWRFKGFMVDMMAGISTAKKKDSSEGGGHYGFVPYQPPKRFMEMARAKFGKAERQSLYLKIGELTHSSAKQVRRDYLPYLKIIMKKDKTFADSLGLLPEEVKSIK